MGMTIAEKIIAAAAGVDSVKPGDIHTVQLDRLMSNDGTTHLTVDMYHNKLKNPKIADKDNLTDNEKLLEKIKAQIKGYYYDDGKWYDGYLNYCVKNRIVSSDEYSSLDAYATRAQIAHIFAKATSDFAVVNDIDYDYIPDVSERSEYADEILALYRAGILTGDERTRAFRPSDTITRAEAAAIISRVALPTTRIKIV